MLSKEDPSRIGVVGSGLSFVPWQVGTFNDMHNGNMKLEHFIDVGKSVPKNYLVERLNAVNKQGITDI